MDILWEVTGHYFYHYYKRITCLTVCLYVYLSIYLSFCRCPSIHLSPFLPLCPANGTLAILLINVGMKINFGERRPTCAPVLSPERISRNSLKTHNGETFSAMEL